MIVYPFSYRHSLFASNVRQICNVYHFSGKYFKLIWFKLLGLIDFILFASKVNTHIEICIVNQMRIFHVTSSIRGYYWRFARSSSLCTIYGFRRRFSRLWKKYRVAFLLSTNNVVLLGRQLAALFNFFTQINLYQCESVQSNDPEKKKKKEIWIRFIFRLKHSHTTTYVWYAFDRHYTWPTDA